MPTTPLGGITLMSNPPVGLKIIQQVVLCNLFSITDNLQDHNVTPMGEDKRLFFTQ